MSSRIRIGRALDQLVTGTGIGLALLVIAACAVTVGLIFERGSRQLEATLAEVDRHQSSRAITGINDLLRLNELIFEATLADSLDDQTKSELQAVMDIIHVRAGHIERRMDMLGYNSSGLVDPAARANGERAVDELRRVVAYGDQLVGDPSPDMMVVATDVGRLINAARVALLQYDDELRLLGNRLQLKQGHALVQLRSSVWLFLVVATGFATASLFLLRSEVRVRHARERAERRADFLAYYDPMTELANRIHFQEHVGKALQETEVACLLLVDLDNFKDVNDRNGHEMGDVVLCEIASRLRALSDRDGILPARLGGDEFAVYLPFDDHDEIEAFCLSLIESCRRPVSHAGETVDPTISVGAAAVSQLGRLGRSGYQTVMKAADFALYHSKACGRDRLTIFDAELEQRFIDRRSMIRDLPDAIRNEELMVYLQPKVDLATRRVYGFEALVRWCRNGVITPPGDFVSVAEESGMILALDRYMIEQSVALIERWNAAHGTDFSVSVNISAMHLLRDGLPSFVEHVLSRHALPPESLTLEITESVELSNWRTVGRSISAIRANGIKIAIDDFGTGYSSLAYLRAVKADELKIDKSLVSEIEESTEAQFILDAVLDLAGSLGLSVVVEGVERDSQADVLRGFGDMEAQGYLFGRPIPAVEALQQATEERAALPASAATVA